VIELDQLDKEIVGCRACPRLVAWREQVAAVKRASFKDQEYWGCPVPGFGQADARLLILGLAPAAHGGNRTGRIFTGDRSGDVLFAALHRAGLANQARSESVDDGLRLYGVRITASVRCAPPDNKPTPQERDTCAHWLLREVALLKPTLRVAWWPVLSAEYEIKPPIPRPAFGHGRLWRTAGAPTLIGSYHVSQQNTFTGRLTPAMLDEVFACAKLEAELE
jgi:uracil-DNA glycosylase family 4